MLKKKDISYEFDASMIFERTLSEHDNINQRLNSLPPGAASVIFELTLSSYNGGEVFNVSVDLSFYDNNEELISSESSPFHLHIKDVNKKELKAAFSTFSNILS